MKLVEILAREFNEWPQFATMAVQDDGGHIKMANGEKPEKSFGGTIWVRDVEIYHPIQLGSHELATDQATAIVTRTDWESERTSLKAAKAEPASVENEYGFISEAQENALTRPAKQQCPVKAKAAERLAKFDPAKTVSLEEMEQRFKEDGRVVEDTQAAVAALLAGAGSKRLAAASEVIITSDPIEWRDRIRELDTQRAEVEATYQCQVSEITKERESLVQKLAGEGLALAEDMSDWRNWKAGDLVEWIGLSSQHYTLGKTYEVEKVLDKGLVMDDNNGGDHRWGGDQEIARAFKWHSRPAS